MEKILDALKYLCNHSDDKVRKEGCGLLLDYIENMHIKDPDYKKKFEEWRKKKKESAS